MSQGDQGNRGTEKHFWDGFFELLYDKSDLRVEEQASVHDWLRDAEPRMQELNEPVFQAVVGGYHADRVAYGFLAGYQSALRHSFDDLPSSGLVAFCVSEKGGAKPTAFKTHGVPQQGAVVINGKKTFVTCGDQADLLLVAYKASEQASGRPLINIAKVKANAPGVAIENMPEMPFIPEVRRGSVLFNDVLVGDSNLYRGDCYLNYAKPFSASEGYFIIAAVIAYLLRVAKDYDWPLNHVDELISLLQFTVMLTKREPLDPQTIIAGNGLRQSLENFNKKTRDLWQLVGERDQSRWLRDGAILFASDRSQQIRLNKARAYYEQE
ncbi:MAG: hypothetical protein COB04_07990 [Gammaproteobacteria bacterium]|nr:MAG: hypothetical protein COB04_07990 [Gammaproteobacteria bacterium]